MADFCWQCTEALFEATGKQNDFAGMTTEMDTRNGYYASVLCEGCGFIEVDHTGKCVRVHCKKHGSDNAIADIAERSKDG
jgi:hypothetical protein